MVEQGGDGAGEPERFRAFGLGGEAGDLNL